MKSIILILSSILLSSSTIASSFNPDTCRRRQEIIDTTFLIRVNEDTRYRHFSAGEKRRLSDRLEERERVFYQAAEMFEDTQALAAKRDNRHMDAVMWELQLLLWSHSNVESRERRLLSYFPPNQNSLVHLRMSIAVLLAQWECSEFEHYYLMEYLKLSKPPHRPVDNAVERRDLWTNINLRPGEFSLGWRNFAAQTILSDENSALVIRRALELARKANVPRNIQWMLIHNVEFHQRHGLRVNSAFEHMVDQVGRLAGI